MAGTTPVESIKMRSGAGRFIVSPMRTMSWFELGFSSGKTSVAKLLKNNVIAADMSEISIDDIVERIIIGGWPGNLAKKIKVAERINKSYIDLISEIDLSKVSKISRDPNKARALLKSLARNISTTANTQTLVDDARQDSDIISRITVNEYLDALERLMLIENQTAWNTHIRSSVELRKTPKRHFADPSMAVSILGLDKEAILNNTEYLGFLFESLVIHNLRVYAQDCDGQVFHYRDSNDKEIDAIVQNRAGQWAAFEVKLGSKFFDEAAKNLIKITGNISKKPASLNIITGTGLTYTRSDGVNVISISSLGI